MMQQDGPSRSFPRVSRRTILGALAAAPLATAMEAVRMSAQSKSATFVLVHGAWHGGWCWKKLMPLLQDGGHRVFAPTLTGLGERGHLLSPAIDLTTHVQDITAVLEYEDLREVILVGHSYGGMVISGVAETATRRLAQLVYLDAFLPQDGKAIKDYAPLNPTREDGWRVPVPGMPPRFGVTDKDDVAWMEARLGDHPAKTFADSLKLSADKTAMLGHSFIQCTKAPFFSEAAERAKREGFRFRELFAAGHDAMITQPRALADILLDLL
jgi:pimeloyl-ACP methyl ester carboxylesterase